MSARYLAVESPDNIALVDYLGAPEVSVKIRRSGGVLTIEVRASHGPESSSWDHHEFEVKLPE